MRLLIDIGKILGKIFIDEFNKILTFFLDHLIRYHSDDASSIKIALKVIQKIFQLIFLLF